MAARLHTTWDTIRKHSHYQKTTKPHPSKKSRPSQESKVQTPSAPADRQAIKEISKPGRVRDLKNLKAEDMTKLHTTHRICTKKNRLRAQQARVSYWRQACEACNDMKIDVRRSNKLLADFQRKTLPLSIPKVEDKSRENEAYWLKPGKTEPLQTKFSLSNLHKASFYHLH